MSASLNERFAKFSESNILVLHGIGPSSILKLRSALESKGLDFKTNQKCKNNDNR